MDYAADLRDRATALAQRRCRRDLDRSRIGLAELAGTCNRCHQTFAPAERGSRRSPTGAECAGSRTLLVTAAAAVTLGFTVRECPAGQFPRPPAT